MVQTVTLDHVAIRTPDLASTERFYAALFDMRPGPRPALPGPGSWLYAEGAEHPLVHLIEVPAEGARDGGMVDHVSFAATGLADKLARIHARDLEYVAIRTPGTDLVQVQVRDPNGVTVEMTFNSEPIRDADLRP